MPILNYTTSIDAEKTVGEIQKKLAAAGARQILSEYDVDGLLSGVSFQIEYKNQPMYFRLPAKFDPIFVVLQNDGKVPRRLRTREQAIRVSWRIIKDWIEAQLALVEADQAEMAEVFLPYAHQSDGETLWQRLERGGLKLLTAQDS